MKMNVYQERWQGDRTQSIKLCIIYSKQGQLKAKLH